MFWALSSTAKAIYLLVYLAACTWLGALLLTLVPESPVLKWSLRLLVGIMVSVIFAVLIVVVGTVMKQ
ncbi:hypothetical protein [Achromobacter phage Motura]|uniref:Uncharacterized protein n=1 Tax=Achromobacter phage Motura TaxID=2591403 RepID=A0A514CSD9_9CAUD|nr:hypothetical protein H1O15_gp071 [Achromobacter phage Motura]QDH83391.1 hypothetical protein [Achromobacter phage Motura]